jgi:hypothetical protein
MRQLKITFLLLACLALFGMRVQKTAQAQAAQSPRKFEHAKVGKDGKQGHRDLACSQCHVSADQPPYAVVGKGTPGIKDAPVTPFPGHASCVQCHNFAVMAFLKPSYCAVCHQSNPTSTQQPGLFADFQTARNATDFGTDFSHVTHRKPLSNDMQIAPPESRSPMLAQAKLTPGAALLCNDCHIQKPFAANQPEFGIESGHATCYTCHLAKPVNAPADFPDRNDCKGCHVLPDASGVRQQAPNIFQTSKVLDFRHADHEFDTRSVKKAVASVVKPRDYLCAECHNDVTTAQTLNEIKAPGQASCVSCHNDRRQPGLPDALRDAVLRTLRTRD